MPTKKISQMAPHELQLHEVYQAMSDWYTGGCRAAIRTFLQRPEQMSIIFTPILREDTIEKAV